MLIYSFIHWFFVMLVIL